MTTNLHRFQTHTYMQNRWKDVGQSLAFSSTTQDEWDAWRNETKRTLKELTGYTTMVRTDSNPVITQEIAFDGYLRQRVEIQTEPGVIMPFYVLIPTANQGPHPVMIATHGHGSGGKAAVVDERSDPGVSAAIDQYNYTYGVKFAQAGFITFCPDARGFGERQEEVTKGDPLDSSCRVLNNMAIPLGQTVTGMWTWDIHRLLDYIETRDDCDAKRIGCGGLSGGGLQTLWATALDQRIKVAVISGYMYGYKESLLDLHANCSCNYVPRLYEHVDMGDIGALIAPRPLLIESGSIDPLNGPSGLDNVYSQLAILRKAYKLHDSEEALKHVIFEGVHMWGGAETVPWLLEYL